MGFFLGTQARVRNSHGKRPISDQAIEVLLYFDMGIRNLLGAEDVKRDDTVEQPCIGQTLSCGLSYAQMLPHMTYTP